ncbi:uncharacterized protein [Drosophila takahashii]|uniref:uncharacterized protein n=1 Tax=Drosophila takahashii TaxID=29030 RepID=UPI001CF7EF19|nr:uncharacterized protein LOC123003245 [Drosophila takahashii]
MILSLRPAFLWLVMLLLLMELVEVWSSCCACPATRCKIPQWPCCNKKSKWYHSVFG